MKRVIPIIIIYSLLISSMSFGQDQLSNLSAKVTAQELADVNLKENIALQENEIQLGENTTKCDVSIDSTLDRLEAEQAYNDSLVDQGFDKTKGIFTRIDEAGGVLNGSLETLAGSTAGIGAANAASGGLNSLSPAVRKQLEDIGAQLKVLQTQRDALNGSISSKKAICGNTGVCPQETINQLQTDTANLGIVKAKMQQLGVQQNQLTAQAQITKGQVTQANAASNVSKAAIKVANANGVIAENKMRELEASIAADEKIVNEILQKAEGRLGDVLLEQQNNSEFELFELARGELDESTQSGRVTISNLEVMSTATAAISLLKCEDLGPVKARSYPLFRAAAATFIASSINDSTDRFTAGGDCILECISLDQIRIDKARPLDSRKFPELNLKEFDDIEPNCKTNASTAQSDGVYINDNNVDDDKNEQINSAVRAMNLHEGLRDAFIKKLRNSGSDLEITGQETKAGALTMFQAAHAAALREVTTREQLVTSAEGQLGRADTWEEESGNMMIVFTAVVAVLTIVAAVVCSAEPFSAAACAAAVAAVVAAVAVLVFWTDDNSDAQDDQDKWIEELEKARLVGLMKCNFPGDNTQIADMKRPGSFPMIHALSVIQARVKQVAYLERDLPRDNFLNYFVENISPSAQYLFHLLFHKAYAQEGTQLTDSLGLNEETGSFRSYMLMRLGAWKLQSNNSALLVDLKPASIDISGLNPTPATADTLFDYIRKNNTTFEGSPIRKTGFPLPETRAIYIGAVVRMLENNISLLEDGFTSAQTNLDAFRRIVNKMRQVFDLKTVGNEDDTSDLTNNNPACMKGDGGFIQVDKDCACKQNGTCFKFKYPSFASQDLSPLKASTELSIQKADALARGDLKAANLADGKLLKQKKALNNFIKVQNRKIFNSNPNANANNNSGNGSQKISDNKKNNFSRNASVSGGALSQNKQSSNTQKATFGFGFDLSINDDLKNRQKKLAAELERQRKKQLAALRNAGLQRRGATSGGPGSLGSRRGRGASSSSRGSRELTKNTERDLTGIEGSQDELSAEELKMESLSYLEWSKNHLTGDQISDDRDSSIFGMISKRYAKSARKLFKFRSRR